MRRTFLTIQQTKLDPIPTDQHQLDAAPIMTPYASPISRCLNSLPVRGAVITKPARFWNNITKSDPPNRKLPKEIILLESMAKN